MIKHFVPLAVFLITMVYCFLVGIPHGLIYKIPFVSLWIFYTTIYCAGLKSTLINKDSIIKIGTITPYAIPILFFQIPSILLVLVFSQINLTFTFQLMGDCLGSLIVYVIAIHLLVKELQKEFQLNMKDKIERLKKGSASKLKLLLINPVNPNRNGLSTNVKSIFPPLGLGIIAALTSDRFHVELVDENVDVFQFQKADLVGITAFTSNANRAYELAAWYRKKNIPVIMGGIHAFMMPDEALQHVDSIVLGEAESIWKDVIADFLSGNLKKKYQGIHLDLSEAALPRRELFSDKYLYATIQTSRGCPMNCNFCSVTPFNGNKYRQRPYEDILTELEGIPQKQIFFIDDNLLGYGKKAEQRAINLFKGMIDKKLHKSWFCQTSLNFGTNEEIIKLAAKAGCRMVFIGLESPEKEQLQEMNKKINIKLDYKKALANINKHGIAVLGAFIYGSDTETKDSMIRKTEYILNNRIDVIDITTLTPLAGTKLFKEFEQQHRLKYTHFPADWDRYDMSELVFKPKLMTEEEYQDTMDICAKKLYSKLTIYKKFIQTLIHTKNLEAALTAYNSNTVFGNF